MAASLITALPHQPVLAHAPVVACQLHSVQVRPLQGDLQSYPPVLLHQKREVEAAAIVGHQHGDVPVRAAALDEGCKLQGNLSAAGARTRREGGVKAAATGGDQHGNLPVWAAALDKRCKPKGDLPTARAGAW